MIFKPVRIYICYLLIAVTGISSNVYADSPSELQLNIKGSTINLMFAPEASDEHFTLGHKKIVQWIEKSANAVADYFEQFPVKNLNLVINPGSGSRIDGTAYHNSTPLIVLSIRTDITEQQLQKDWVLVHEMVHLAFPPMRRKHSWAEEGLATYVEPLVRVRAGMMSEEDVWRWLIKGTPNGVPKNGDKGLDNTSSWGMKYWGGAIYFLLADIQIHEATNNKYGLEHALRAINKAGGSMALESTWTITKALSIGDKALETNTLFSLYNEMKSKAFDPELENIWKKYGVRLKNDQIIFDKNRSELRREIIYR